jgi:predicted nucleic acid-binding protein
MVAVDTSTFVAYLQGARGRDIELLEHSLRTSDATLPAVVLVELLSDLGLPDLHRAAILELPILETRADYWLRAAASRAAVLSHKLRARLPDTLIAQSCIDNDVALVTRDGDFRHFARHCGLKLA